MAAIKFLVFVVTMCQTKGFSQFVTDNSMPTSDATVSDILYATSQEQETKNMDVTEKENKKPFVHVCCPTGLFYRNRSCFKDEQPAPEIDFPDIYTADLKPSNMTAQDFHWVYRYPCKDNCYGLSPKTDDIYLMENGIIYQKIVDDSMFIDQNEYCLAMITNSNRSVTVVAVCFPSPPSTVNLFAICNLISSIFLAATFITYVVLPDLQNSHGQIVKTYIGIFTCGQFVLSFVQLYGAIYSQTLCVSLGNYKLRKYEISK